jgi:hypothetical protein
MWRSHGKHGRDACATGVLGDPGLRAFTTHNLRIEQTPIHALLAQDRDA